MTGDSQKTPSRWLDIAFGVVVGVLVSTALVAALILVVRPPFGEPIRLVRATPSPLVVHVAGAVEKPGVYALPRGSRVRDAIEAAGGPLPQADVHALNLAQPLQDGQRIYVPPLSDTKTSRASSSPIDEPTATPLPREARLNLNTATEKELETLPGIGPVLARRIVVYRSMHGPFQTVDDLLAVQGIGPVLLEKIRPYVYVDRTPVPP